MKVGVAETVLEVPLFTELYGYGPFLGRRNIGIRDPLYCRALTVTDGNRRNLIIVTDAVVTDDLDARILRARLSVELGILPQGILLAATHTHSGPAMSFGIGWGEMNPTYLAHWRDTVMKTAKAAVKNEEEIRAFAGCSLIHTVTACNRADPKANHTDKSIRWIKIVRTDGSVKTLIHNYGMHGVVFGPSQKRVSADWMGEANHLIRERKLAEVPFFVYGAAGDINFNWRKLKATPEERESDLKWAGECYVNDLENGMASGGKEIQLAPIQSAFDTVELPTCIENAEQLRHNAELLKETWPFASDRYTEMAILAEQGKDFRVLKDLQSLRMGDFVLYAFPGEPFLKLGQDIMAKSPFPLAMPVGVANGNGRYFPIPETFRRFPVINPEKFDYGYYEIWAGAGRYMPRYRENIAEFLVDKLLHLELK